MVRRQLKEFSNIRKLHWGASSEAGHRLRLDEKRISTISFSGFGL